MKLRGMITMKKEKIILIAISLLIITFLPACGAKLELTKANIEKTFSSKYDVGVSSINDTNKSISVILSSKNDIPKANAKDTLTQIQTTLSNKFDISNNNIIEVNVKGHTLIKDTNGKIQVGEGPKINIKESLFPISPVYSMSNKFNLLKLDEYNIKVTATDYEDGDLTNKITIKNKDILTKLGTQNLIYEVADSDGNTATNNSLKVEVIK